MKKVYLSALGFFLLCRLNSNAQNRRDTTTQKATINTEAPLSNNSNYLSRKLRVDEVNFASSYYTQTGNHSAITGGIGTQKVIDVANVLDVKLVWLNKSANTNTVAFSTGVDYHTSASSAFLTNSGKGKQDGTRTYPALDYTFEDLKKGTSIGGGVYYSGEYNYVSRGIDAHFSIKTKDRSGEFTFKAQAYFDEVKLIYPAELVAQLAGPVPPGATYITTASGNTVLSTSAGAVNREPNLPSSPRNTYTASFGYSQIINKSLQVQLLGDLVTQHGFLSLPYHRVYFSNGRDTIERLPASRFRLPLGLRVNYFAGDRTILRAYYRYYTDDWGTKSNTANLELVYKLSPFFSISPFYRFYGQSAAKYFAPYEQNVYGQTYFTSNYEYAKFTSNFFGAGLRLAPPKGLGWQHIHDLELRYGHYAQTTNLVSDVISLNIGLR